MAFNNISEEHSTAIRKMKLDKEENKRYLFMLLLMFYDYDQYNIIMIISFVITISTYW